MDILPPAWMKHCAFGPFFFENQLESEPESDYFFGDDEQLFLFMKAFGMLTSFFSSILMLCEK